MKIVILDGYTSNPGDLDWNAIGGYGALTVYERTPREKVVERCVDAQIVLTNKCPMSRQTIEQLPQLQYIGVLATGTNIVDLSAASDHGIVVTNIPAYGTMGVAQAVFSLILHFTNQVAEHARAVKKGGWCSSDDFCFTLSPLHCLEGKTLGVIGYGAIGRAVAAIGRAFAMKVLFYTRTPVKAEDTSGDTCVPLEALFSRSDIITLNCPLTEATEKMINRSSLELMKNSAILINTGRGGLIDEAALAEALNCGRISGAGLDVLSAEPPNPDNPLLQAENCIVTPHIAWASVECRKRLVTIAAQNIHAYLEGKPENFANQAALPVV